MLYKLENEVLGKNIKNTVVGYPEGRTQKNLGSDDSLQMYGRNSQRQIRSVLKAEI
jgi:hypothetical protein